MPTEELESALRSAFVRAAADIEDPQQARGRLLQRDYRPGRGHRKLTAGLTAATAAAAVVLGLGLTGAFSSASGTGGIRTTAPARDTGTIQTTAFTLVEHANGTATLTIHPNELLDAAALQNDLHRDRIPALVTSGSFCHSVPAPAGLAQVASFYPMPGPQVRNIPPAQATITFNPAAIPPGTELSFGDFQLSSGGQQADFALIDTNSYTCTSTPPPFSSHDGVELLTGGPAGS